LVEPRHRWREEGGSPPLSLSLIPERRGRASGAVRPPVRSQGRPSLPLQFRSRPPRRGPGEAYPEDQLFPLPPSEGAGRGVTRGPSSLTPPACPPALPSWLIRSFHLDLVEYRRGGRVAETELARLPTSKGLPSTRRCSGRGRGGRPPVPRTGAGPSLPGLRCRAVVVPSSLRNDDAAIVAGARHVPGGRTVLVESVCRQGGATRGQCRRGAAREATPAKARLAPVAWGSPPKSRAWLSPQLYR